MHHGSVPVDVERLQKAHDYIKWVNNIPLEEILFIRRNFPPFTLTKEDVDYWKFAGLSNKFVAEEYGIINE